MTAKTTAMIPECPLCKAIDAEILIEVKWLAHDDMQIGAIDCPECKGEIEWSLLTRADQEKIEEAAWGSYDSAEAEDRVSRAEARYDADVEDKLINGQ